MEIVLRAFDGLGNQFFRYAALRYYGQRYSAKMKIFVEPEQYAQSFGYPRPCLLHHYAISVPIEKRSFGDRFFLTDKAWIKPAAAVAKRVLRTQVFEQHHLARYDFSSDLPLEQHVRRLYLVGFWHTYVLVEKIAAELRSELTLKEPAKDRNLALLQQIGRCANPVSLHLRRGDCTVAATNRVDLPLAYYLNAISFFKKQLRDPTFFVFSDDIPFIKDYLPRDLNLIFVDHNDDYSAHEDMRLMSSCHHHITANSTFSWWGAWLNPRTDKIVLAPKQWYQTEDSYYPELLPPSWMLIDVGATTEQCFSETVLIETPLGAR